tara:strand:+ start:4016 stop:4681 length:666 start_codon:yes stop_codon:yes gene_type:complete
MIVPFVKNCLPNINTYLHNPFININFNNNLLLPFIAYNVIIGPHGITDLIYAIEYKKIVQLLGVYTSTITFFNWLHVNQYEKIINTLFITLSTIHFKNDIPINNKYIQLFFSILFVGNLKSIGLPIFLLYMCLLHVPNHYLTYFDLLKKNKILFFSTITTSIITLCSNNLLTRQPNSNMIKAVIVSHILYEELYSKEKHKNILNYFSNNDYNNGKNMALYI